MEIESRLGRTKAILSLATMAERPTTCAVLGAGGFLGQLIAAELCLHGNKVYGYGLSMEELLRGLMRMLMVQTCSSSGCTLQAKTPRWTSFKRLKSSSGLTMTTSRQAGGGWIQPLN